MNNRLKEDIIILGGLCLAAFAAWMMVLMQSVEDALFTAHFMPWAMIFLLWFAVRKTDQKADERERAGLRGKWKAEDHDEIEERVRKLEEKYEGKV